MEQLRLKKIFAIVPAELYEELQRRNKLSTDFDSWLAEAIQEKLQREDAQNVKG